MINKIFTNRRAVSNFSNDVVTDDQINDLIEAFQTAPCGMHQADVMNLVVVKDEGLRQEIENATDNSCYNAPILFVINTKKNSMFGERDASGYPRHLLWRSASRQANAIRQNDC